VAAVAVEERLPAWNPPDVPTARTEYVGVVRIDIGADGRVSNATIVEPSHPAYDVMVLQAAKRWVYKPATRGGTPVASQKDIRIRLVPR
jgi:TonB family protein